MTAPMANGSTPPRGLARLGSYGVYVPVLLLGVLALAYWVYWSAVAAEIERQARRFADVQASQGVEVAWDRLSVDGFPLRMTATLDAPRARGGKGDTAWRWTAPQLVIDLRPYAPNHLIAQVPGAQTYEGAAGRWTLNPANALASLIVTTDGAFQRLDIDLRKPSLDGVNAKGERVTVEAHRAQLHLRQADGADTGLRDVVLSAERAVVGGDVRLLMGPEIASLRLEGKIERAPAWSGPDSRESAESWTRAGGAIDLTAGRLRWGALDVEGRGRVWLDAERRLAGRLSALAGGYPELLQALEAEGQMSRDDRNAGALLLSALAVAGGDPKGRVPVEITMAGGELRLGPQPVAALEPLF